MYYRPIAFLPIIITFAIILVTRLALAKRYVLFRLFSLSSRVVRPSVCRPQFSAVSFSLSSPFTASLSLSCICYLRRVRRYRERRVLATTSVSVMLCIVCSNVSF